MNKKQVFIGMLVILFLFGSVTPIYAQSVMTVHENRAALNFPDTLTFKIDLESRAEIEQITLEYGTDQLTCGTVHAKAFPTFTPSKKVSVSWTWEMRQSGSLPPGATVWWRWHVQDKQGNQTSTEIQTITWLDRSHNWKSIKNGNIHLHWYDGDQSFGSSLHTAAVEALTRLENETGLKAESPIDLYIYKDFSDMRDAILYEPSWTGGVAFPEHNIVIIGISQDNVEWGKLTQAHEIVHVLVGHLTFSCLGDVPTWLNEGLAVWGEGGLDAASQTRLDSAIRNNTLFPIRSLSGGFSEVADKADLSYSQSYSIVRYLIDTYGKEKITQVLTQLRDGYTIEEALLSIYGFNLDALEDEWRANIGAAPRALVANPTPTMLPTPVPTIVPISGIPSVSTPNITLPTPQPTSQDGFPLPESGAFPIALILMTCCGLLGLAAAAAAVAIFFIKQKNGGSL